MIWNGGDISIHFQIALHRVCLVSECNIKYCHTESKSHRKGPKREERSQREVSQTDRGCAAVYFFYLAQQITVIKVQLSGFSLHIIKHGQHGEREGVQTDLLEASHAAYWQIFPSSYPVSSDVVERPLFNISFWPYLSFSKNGGGDVDIDNRPWWHHR